MRILPRNGRPNAKGCTGTALLALGKAQGLPMPPQEPKIATNFISDGIPGQLPSATAMFK